MAEQQIPGEEEILRNDDLEELPHAPLSRILRGHPVRFNLADAAIGIIGPYGRNWGRYIVYEDALGRLILHKCPTDEDVKYNMNVLQKAGITATRVSKDAWKGSDQRAAEG